MPRTTKSVTEKNTKQEIFAAYQELLTEASSGSSSPIISPEEKVVVSSAASQTVEKITADLSTLKLSFTQAVNDLADRLTAEAETLTIIQKAISIAKKELEETQKIKVTAGLLYRLMEVQKKKEVDFEKEIAEKWEAMEKLQERDEEEYAYAKKLQKERDADERENERFARERKMQEEKEVKEALVTELNDLRKKVTATPTETERAVKDAVTKAVAQSQMESGVKAQLTKQQSDAELNLARVKADMLESTVKAQMQDITILKKQLEDATRQVKDIAVSVIENTRKESTPSNASQDK